MCRGVIRPVVFGLIFPAIFFGGKFVSESLSILGERVSCRLIGVISFTQLLDLCGGGERARVLATDVLGCGRVRSELRQTVRFIRDGGCLLGCVRSDSLRET